MSFSGPSNHIYPSNTPFTTMMALSDSDTEEDNLDPIHLSPSLFNEAPASANHSASHLQNEATSIECVTTSTLSAQRPVEGIPILSGRTSTLYASDSEYRHQKTFDPNCHPAHGILPPLPAAMPTSPAPESSLATRCQPLETASNRAAQQRQENLNATFARVENQQTEVEQRLNAMRVQVENDQRELGQSLNAMRVQAQNHQRELEQSLNAMRAQVENQRRTSEQRLNAIHSRVENPQRTAEPSFSTRMGRLTAIQRDMENRQRLLRMTPEEAITEARAQARAEAMREIEADRAEAERRYEARQAAAREAETQREITETQRAIDKINRQFEAREAEVRREIDEMQRWTAALRAQATSGIEAPSEIDRDNERRRLVQHRAEVQAYDEHTDPRCTIS